MFEERTITNNSCAAYGDFVHDVHYGLTADHGLMVETAYELVGRYPTLVAHMYTSGRDTNETVSALMVGYERSRS